MPRSIDRSCARQQLFWQKRILQYCNTAIHCNTLQHTLQKGPLPVEAAALRAEQCTATLQPCNTLQYSATQCNQRSWQKIIEGAHVLRVEFLLKTENGYSRDASFFPHSRWHTLGVPSVLTPIGQHHQSPPSPVPGDLGMSQSPVSRNSNIERRMDRPKAVVGVIRGVA